MTTHVVCGKCNDSEYREFKKYQDVHVVSKDWVVESLKFKRRVLEEDYTIKPCREQKTKSINYIKYNSEKHGFETFKVYSSQRQLKDSTVTQSSKRSRIRPFEANNQNSSQNELFENLPTLKKSRSMNPKISSFRTEKKKAESKNEIKFKSLLFKNCYFYFPDNIKGMSIYKRKVLEHSGSIVTSLSKVQLPENKKIFAIFKDGDFDETSVKKYKPYKEKIMVLSFRYVLFCIDKKTVVQDPVSEKLIHLLPFPKKIYSEEFKKVKIFVKGFDLEKNCSLLKTCEILGFHLAEEQDEADLVVVDDKLYSKLTKKMREEFKGIFVKEKYLLKCLTNGKLTERSKKKLSKIRDFGFDDEKKETNKR